MQNIRQFGDLHMAMHINKRLYEQGKITDEMYRGASRMFVERLLELEKDSANALHETV